MVSTQKIKNRKQNQKSHCKYRRKKLGKEMNIPKYNPKMSCDSPFNFFHNNEIQVIKKTKYVWIPISAIKRPCDCFFNFLDNNVIIIF